MAADVVGYSRLMGEDEAGTLARLKAHREELVEPEIAAHRGRIVKLMGDGILVEFASVVDALECSVALQRGMAERTKDEPEAQRFTFRVGVNLGDVMIDAEDIYGNGVNVAARLEALAEPGGICISGRVLDQVEKNVDVGFAYLGPQNVKNIGKPVNAYKVLLNPTDAGKIIGAPTTNAPSRRWLITAVLALFLVAGGVGFWHLQIRPDFEPAATAKMAYPLPDDPSIAVLPFENFSGEGKDDFITRGLTEDVITALSKLPQLFVISRTSSFAFRGKAMTATEIAEQLGVRYILEGSIQRSGDTLRISAQLVDAVKGHHLWADNFDGEANDLFTLQDDIVRRILVELQVELTTGDHARVASRGTTNLDAWLLREQGMAELYKFTRESTLRTRELFQQAHEMDPSWARPLGGLAFTYWYEARKGWADDREGSIQKGVELAEKAIEMDPKEPLGYMQLGNLHQLMGNHERAIELREKAVAIAPNDFQANWGLGVVLYRAGQIQRAVEVLEHAERVSPRHPASFTWALSSAQLFAGQYEDVIQTASQAKARTPDKDLPRILLAAAYSALGRMEEAKNEAQELLRVDPKFSVSGWIDQGADFKEREILDKVANLLVQAGLPE
jgi:TolB-like protein